MRIEYKDHWLEKARHSLSDTRASHSGDINLDVQALIRIATDKRIGVLYHALSPRERNFLYELRGVRNRHAHQEVFTDRDVEHALNTLALFLDAVQCPEVADVAQLRRPAPFATRKARATLERAAEVSESVRSGLLSTGDAGVKRGVRLFRYLAERANGGEAIGIGYGDFIAFLNGKSSFREVAGRNYLPSDSGAAIELAWRITDANGGRLPVTRGGLTIRCGMDTFIWTSSSPYDRPEKAWHNARCLLPYSRAEWKAVFPDSLRRLMKPGERAILT